MDTIDAIFTRRSVRSYEDRAVSDEALEIILRAAQAGPSCANTRDWQFLVVRDREILSRMAEANGRPAQGLKAFRSDIKRRKENGYDRTACRIRCGCENRDRALHGQRGFLSPHGRDDPERPEF